MEETTQKQSPAVEETNEKATAGEQEPLKTLVAAALLTPQGVIAAPSVAPAEEVKKAEKTTFSTIRQGNVTNTLTKIKPDLRRNTVIKKNGKGIITEGNFTVTIPKFLTTEGLKTSTYQLLDALTVALTESGAKNREVILSLNEYIKKRGVKDRSEAKKQVLRDLDALYAAEMTFKEKKGQGQEDNFRDVRIIESKGIINGFIVVSFSTTLLDILKRYTVMAYPPQLWRLNNKRNPNSYFLLRKIAEHKNMNVGKKNEDTIAVKTLLSVTPYIPTYDEVMATNGGVNKRIISTFERDMNALDDTLTWAFYHNNGKQLTGDERKRLTYEDFIKLMIKTSWREYPDQTERLKRKAARIAQAGNKRRPIKK